MPLEGSPDAENTTMLSTRVPPGSRRLARLCVLKFDETTHEMYLAERYEGVTPEQVQQNTGFALDPSRAALTEPPTAEELRILRDDVAPQRLILG